MEEKREHSISLADIVRVLWKHIILIAIIVIAFTLVGGIYTFGITKPKYKSSTQIVVAVTTTSSTSGDTVSSTDSLRLVKTVASLATSKDVTKLVADDLKANGEEYKESYLQSIVSASSQDNVYIVTVTATSTNSKEAVKIVNLYADNLIEYFTSNASYNNFKANLVHINVAENAAYASPNKLLYMAVFVLLGIVGSVVVVFLLEFASNKYKTKDEIETALGESALGLFVDHKEKKNDSDINLVNPTIQEFEPYNRLISNIKYANVDNPYKVIMLTSTIEDELKSTTITNLAYTLVNNDKKVVLIDLDLRKPAVHKAFSLTNNEGVVEFVDGSLDKDQVIKHTEHNIDVITSGKKVLNPFTIINSNKLKELIDELRNEYDYVLIDTPPLAICSDGQEIAKICDGVLYNVTVNQVRKKLFLESYNNLKENSNNVIGVNITKIPVSKRDRNGYYYYSYYSNYYKDEEKASSKD